MIEYILAIDPSITSTGYAVMRKDTHAVIDLGKVTTKKGKEAEHVDEDNRIVVISDTLMEIVERYEIETAVLETQFVLKNIKTALKLSRLRGALMLMLKHLDVQIEYLEPSKVRSAIMGNGSAKKEDVADFIAKSYKNNFLVESLGAFNDKNNKNKNSDMFDAVSIGLAYLTLHKSPMLVKASS